HGTSVPLANTSGVLRVLVTASPEVRAERLMALTDVGEPQAKKAIEYSDRERQKFFRRIHDLRQELPTQYDLVVNTDRFTVPEAVKLIVAASKK
ncbi:MAG: AAA family ATPase, partial [Candidatus Binatia bacterium]